MKSLFPAVTCILTSNGRPTLGDALESVLNQTRLDYHVLVLDSGWWVDKVKWTSCPSPESNERADVVKWLYEKHKDHPRIDWIFTGEAEGFNKQFCPVGKVFNEVVRQGLIKGKYFCCHYDDDVYYPTFMEKMAGYLDERPDVAGVRCTQDRKAIMPEGKETPPDGVLLADKVLTPEDTYTCAVDGMQVMIRTEVLHKMREARQIDHGQVDATIPFDKYEWLPEHPDQCGVSDGIFFDRAKYFIPEMHYIKEALCAHRHTPDSTYAPTK